MGAEHEEAKIGIYLDQQGFTADPEFFASGEGGFLGSAGGRVVYFAEGDGLTAQPVADGILQRPFDICHAPFMLI
jgi:hypothetical protein